MPDYFQAVRRDGSRAIKVLESLTDLNIQNEFGQNLLHEAVGHKNDAAALELIRRGVNVNHQDRRMAETPLHFAAALQNVEVVKAILSHGGDFTILDKNGNTPLWCAVFNARGKYETIDAFIAAGASKIARLKNKHGRSPFDFAQQIGDNHLLSIL